MKRVFDACTNVFFWILSPVWVAALLLFLALRWMVSYHPPGRRQ